jgi:chemotaxis protein MotB
MARRKKAGTGAPAWMTTFADMATILLCFLVLILSFSVIEKQKFVKVAASLKNAFGVQADKPVIGSATPKIIGLDLETVPLHVSFMENLAKALQEEINAGLVEVEEDESSLTLRVKDVIAFASGSAEIKPEFKPFLDKLGKAILENGAQVVVSGHTDNMPLRAGTPFRSNWGLSASRAVNVVEYWVDGFGIPPSLLSATGYAHGQPVAPNGNPLGRAENRRVEFKLTPTTQLGTVFEGINIFD